MKAVKRTERVPADANPGSVIRIKTSGGRIFLLSVQARDSENLVMTATPQGVAARMAIPQRVVVPLDQFKAGGEILLEDATATIAEISIVQLTR